MQIIPLEKYTVKAFIRRPKICVWASSIFFHKRIMDWGHGQKRKKNKQTDWGK
jgi:hypothetical protein